LYHPKRYLVREAKIGEIKCRRVFKWITTEYNKENKLHALRFPAGLTEKLFNDL